MQREKRVTNKTKNKHMREYGTNPNANDQKAAKTGRYTSGTNA